MSHFIERNVFAPKPKEPKKPEAEMVGKILGEEGRREFEKRWGKEKRAPEKMTNAEVHLERSERLLSDIVEYKKRSRHYFEKAAEVAEDGVVGLSPVFLFVQLASGLRKAGEDPSEAIRSAESKIYEEPYDHLGARFEDCATELAKEGQFEHAKELASRIPDEVEFRYHIQDARKVIVDEEVAAGKLELALQDADPLDRFNKYSALLNIAIAYARTGEQEKAEQLVQRLYLGLGTEVYVALAVERSKSGADYEPLLQKAIKVFEASAGLDPFNRRFYASVFAAKELVQSSIQGSYWEAFFQEAKLLKGPGVEKNTALIEVLALAKRFEEAKQMLHESGDLNASARFQSALIVALEQAKGGMDTSEMFAVARSAAEEENNIELFFSFAEAVAKAGLDPKEALEAAEERIDPENIRSLIGLAASYAVVAKEMKSRVNKTS